MRSLRILGILLGCLAVAGCAAQPGATTAPPSAANPTAGAGASGGIPTGIWTMTLTPDDIRAAGFTDPGAAAENAGTFTFSIAPDGTWTIAQATSQPVKWPVFRGTYAVTGADTVDMRTTFPPEYDGDIASMRLSEGPDGLAVKILSPDDPVLRMTFETYVWKRSP